MSNFIDAFNFMMSNEDMERQYKVVPDSPPGAWAISGINSDAYPHQYATIAAIPQAKRGPAIEQFYQTEFWNTWLEQLVSDNLAERVFDSAVNMGPGSAVRLLQVSVNSLQNNALHVDGGWGPNTVLFANQLSIPDDCNIVSAFKNVRREHYQHIVTNNPANGKYLAGWLARATK